MKPTASRLPELSAFRAEHEISGLGHIRSRLTPLKTIRRLKVVEEMTREVMGQLIRIEQAGMIPTEKDVREAIKLRPPDCRACLPGDCGHGPPRRKEDMKPPQSTISEPETTGSRREAARRARINFRGRALRGVGV